MLILEQHHNINNDRKRIKCFKNNKIYPFTVQKCVLSDFEEKVNKIPYTGYKYEFFKEAIKT